MTEHDFEYIRKLLQERSAIVLEADKHYLVENRLEPIVRQLNMTSIGELVERLRSRPSHALYTSIVEAMVTTETSFFRDHFPFEEFRKVVIPKLVERRRAEGRLNIWCAGCSSGQEPYSLAMMLREHFSELAGWKITLLASDLSREMLARARDGRFNQVEVNRGLPAKFLVRYFEQEGATWQLTAAIRAMVEFREINLAGPWPALPPMDLVLLRNVMIYFDVETKKAILGKVARLLRADGYFLLGAGETTLNLDESYRRVEHLKTGFYQLASG